MDTFLWKRLIHYFQTPLSVRGKRQEGNTEAGVVLPRAPHKESLNIISGGESIQRAISAKTKAVAQ